MPMIALHAPGRSSRFTWSLLAVLVAVAQMPGECLAQAESDSEKIDQRPSGLDLLYGGVSVAGSSDEKGEPAETNFGLERMYGGVSGQAGVHGSKSGGPKKGAPEFHVVKKGDTLWALSNTYYGNPWAWPQVWSLNPQIENPHWIYPGDQVRTRSAITSKSTKISEDNSAGPGGMVGRSRLVPQGTIFVRDQGYIGDPKRDVWGEVVGSHEDQMLLTDGNTVYLLMKDGVDLRLGQRLTVFKEVAAPPKVNDSRDPPGKIVKIYGTLRVDAWDPKARVAKTVLIESVDSIERGFSVGPVGRRFDVVPPTAATADVEARILTSLHPHIYFGQNQLVFIDKGSEDGLVAGNRLRILRRGDTWRRNLLTANHHARMRVEMGSPELPEGQTTPLHGNDDKFPDEVVGELRVLRTEEYSSICMVVESTRGLTQGDRAIAVEGY